MSVSSKASFAINIVGHVSGNLGLGVLARDITKALCDRQIPIAIFDVDPGAGRWKYDRRFEAYEAQDVDALPYNVTLFMLSPPTLAEFVLAHPGLMLRNGVLNIAHTMWELPVLPKVMRRTLGLFDALVAESKFLQSTLEGSLPEMRTLYAEHPLHPLSGVVACREKFGLPEDAVVFVNSFDLHSDTVRKNPLAVIEAFKRGLGEDRRGFLVVKMNGSGKSEGTDRLIQQVREECRGHPRIRLLAESLPYGEVMNLYASCDVFVSLHRAEGLGLALMEAMSLGKPVIATSWSGNMSFMDETNSCLVGYELVPVEGSAEVYTERFLGTKAHWAEPSIDEAAAWMKRLVDDASLRACIGKKAADSMRTYQTRARRVGFVDELRGLWDGEWQGKWTAQARRAELLRLERAMAPKAAGPARVLGNAIKKTLDRYLLWRFKAAGR